MDSMRESKLLVVGAGGIGCELLKDLILTGFTQIEVIDLDTIELSNLNRQFLFQKCHVGKPKAIIARDSVLKYNPSAHIVAHHDSIFNTKFGVDYFKQFSIVLNALDNKSARSHVNRLCLAADVPLIESGSAGYLGQVTLIKRSLTECYDCLPKPPAKSFPGCTIRNTPSEPIHCIVWAKHLFNQLFGAEDPDEAVSPDGEDPENMAEAGKAAIEKAPTEEAVVRQSTRQWAKETDYDAQKIFNKLFNDDIKYLLSMSKLWEERRPPRPLEWTESYNSTSSLEQYSESNGQVANSSKDKLESHRILSLHGYSKMFSDSVLALHKRLESSTDENPILVWDKDDEDAMNFVTCASNLRCFIFSITLKTKFEVKSLAGSIIPAIASTNAIVAGLIVLEALKVLNNKTEECKTVYIRDKPSNNKLIVSTALVKPNEKCYVCASQPEITVKLNVNTFTVKQFETRILKRELNMAQPDVEIDDGTGRIIISSEEGETEDNNDKTLAHFGLTDNSSLKCDDFLQNYQLKIVLFHCDKFEADSGKEYEIISENQMLKDLQEKLQKDKEQQIVEADAKTVTESESQTNKKRQYETAFQGEEYTNGASIKKLKSSSNLTDEIVLEDDDCLIEENSNEEESSKSVKTVSISNDKQESNDDDIIECTSDEDVIELNDNGYSNESANAEYCKIKKLKTNESDKECVENGKHLKEISTSKSDNTDEDTITIIE